MKTWAKFAGTSIHCNKEWAEEIARRHGETYPDRVFAARPCEGGYYIAVLIDINKERALKMNEARPEPYGSFDRAFAHISAYAIMNGKEYVAKVVTSRNGSTGTVTAWVQVFGARMAKGKATGGGYDMVTAAVEDAALKIDPTETDDAAPLIKRIKLALFNGPDGTHWDTRLREAGYGVLTVI